MHRRGRVKENRRPPCSCEIVPIQDMTSGAIGHHHHIAGAYLVCYAQESAWREDHRLMDICVNLRPSLFLSALKLSLPVRTPEFEP